MSDLMIHAVPDRDLEIIKALADARQQSLEEYLLEIIHENAMGADNRVKLAVIAERLNREQAEPIPMDVIIAAKNDRGYDDQ